MTIPTSNRFTSPDPQPCPRCHNGFIRSDRDVRACGDCHRRTADEVAAETRRLLKAEAHPFGRRRRDAAPGAPNRDPASDTFPWFST